RVLIPPAAGVFSALGLLRSDVEQEFVRPAAWRGGEVDQQRLESLYRSLGESARATLLAEDYRLEAAQFRYSADLRYTGQAYELTVRVEDFAFAEMAEAFHREHERTYGHRSDQDEVQLVNARLTVRIPLAAPLPHFGPDRTLARHDRKIAFEGMAEPATVPVIGRREVGATPRPGPYVIEEYDTTCIVPPSYTGRIDARGNIELCAVEA